MKTNINEELLFKYFRAETSAEENRLVSEWLEEDQANKQRFKDSFNLYETLLLGTVREAAGNAGTFEKNVPSGSNTRRRKTVRTIIIAAANIAAAAAIIFGAKNIAQNTIRRQLSKTMAKVEAPAGQQADFTLPDGTRVKLNSGASLSYPIVFSKKAREVTISGEAYFSVTHDSAHPFIVRTFASDIEVLGTEFNVIAEEASNTFSVALIKGSVKVGKGNSQILMKPDETVSLIEGRLSKLTGTAGQKILWTKGIIDIGNIGFSELMRKFEKAFGVKIIIDRPTIPELNCTGGEVRINDGIDYALKVLQHLSDFRYERSAEGETIKIM